MNRSKAKVDLKANLKEVEELLKKNQPGNKYLLDSKEFSYADAIISPYLVRLYIAIKEGHLVIAGVNMKDYPHLSKYIDNLLANPDLKQAYNLDEQVNIDQPKQEEKKEGKITPQYSI